MTSKVKKIRTHRRAQKLNSKRHERTFMLFETFCPQSKMRRFLSLMSLKRNERFLDSSYIAAGVHAPRHKTLPLKTDDSNNPAAKRSIRVEKCIFSPIIHTKLHEYFYESHKTTRTSRLSSLLTSRNHRSRGRVYGTRKAHKGIEKFSPISNRFLTLLR